MNKKQIIGIGIFVLLIVAIVVIKNVTGGGEKIYKNLTNVYVATGGGKEDFLADERVQTILKEKL